MIQWQNLALARQGQLLFEQASGQIHPGWKVGLTGRNGTGKSSLFAALLGELTPEAGELQRPAQWTVAHMAQEVEALEATALDYVLSGDAEWWQIQQQLAAQPTPAEEAALHARFADIDGYTARARASQLLAGLGFAPQDETREVAAFSGGWRMRLNLARTLMCRSDLLLLDEPTNHLDLDAVLWLEQWLQKYRGTLLLISHDRDLLDKVCDHILHVEQQKLTLYSGNYSTFEETRAQRLAQQQQAYEQQQAVRQHLQKYIDRFKAQATRARQAQSRMKQLERMQLLAAAHVDSPFTFQFREPQRMSSPLLRLSEASVGYPGLPPVLQQVSLTLQPDSRIGLLGMNGAGKSTLIKALVGVLPLSAGSRQTSDTLALGYFSQHQLDGLDLEATPLLQLARLAGPQVHEAQLRAYLGSFGFSGERMDTVCQRFSGGEKARLALALLIWQRPNVLVLDEPTNHLDLEMRHALTLALQDFAGAVVLVSHERPLISAVCNELWLVHGGRCVPFDGDLQAYAQWSAAQRQPRAQDAPATVAPPAQTAPVMDRAEQRRLAAQWRTQTRPLRQAIEKLEQQLQHAQQRLRSLEQELGDAALYEASQKSQLLQRLTEQTELNRQCADWEDQLLNHMLELESLEAQAPQA